MQDSHCKLILKQHWSIAVIMILTPLLLYAVTFILPTFDDWTAVTAPSFEPFFIKERFLFFGYHWRPFDSFVGYVNGLNPQLLFPLFNHCLIVLGHALCAVLIYYTTSLFHFSTTARNISALFFFIAPATMATVLAVDSINQTYALFWGLASFIFYWKMGCRWKYVLWIGSIFIATLFKENGLMWALIGPTLAYGFNKTDSRLFRKDFLVGLSVMLFYALAVVLLPKDITIHPDYVPTASKMVHNVVKFLFSSFVTVDYIYLLHQPDRNLPLAALTLLLSFPFIYLTVLRRPAMWMKRQLICLAVCLLLAVVPHLGTIFSMMHAYAGLPFVAFIIAFAIEHCDRRPSMVVATFLLFVVSSMMINIHLYRASVASALTGKRMAQEAVRKTGRPVRSVYLVIIDDDYPKLSSFCVVPAEAFGWGIAARHETGYQWPELICDTTIERSGDALEKAKAMGQRKLSDRQFDCVWIVDHQHIDVMK